MEGWEHRQFPWSEVKLTLEKQWVPACTLYMQCAYIEFTYPSRIPIPKPSLSLGRCRLTVECKRQNPGGPIDVSCSARLSEACSNVDGAPTFAYILYLCLYTS